MKKEDIDLAKPNIMSLFSIGKKYIIPRYQRAFAWEKSNAENLWKDIENILSGKNAHYFIGSIVLSKLKDSDALEVIDGQQRLTTLSLLLLALYLEYQEIDSKAAIKHILPLLKAGDIDDEYEILTLSRTNLDLYSRLISFETKSDFEVFKKEEYSKQIKSNKNLIDILSYFIDKIAQNKEEDHNLELLRLNTILKSIRAKIFFLEISVPDYAEASKLFEVLNNRGVDLTKADLIKNHLFDVAEQQSTLNDVEKDWYAFEDSIGTDKVEQFFRYFSLIYSKEADLYKRMEKTIHVKSAKTVSQLIIKHSTVYKIFLDSSFSTNDIESSLYDELSYFGVTQYYSFLMSAYDKFSMEDILELLSFMVKFTFRYSTICGKNPNKVETLYAELAYDINDGKETVKTIKDKVIKLNPSKEEFKLKFCEKEFKSTKIPRYILGKTEEFISTDEKNIDYSSVHLEHIMPKKIEKWEKENIIFIDLHKRYLHNIGNMTLLSEKINTSIKNNVFSIKQQSYEKSEINLITDITSKSVWKETEILENQKRYYNYAAEIWKID